VTTFLKREGYQIGKKKTYRLMEEQGLLRPKYVLVQSFDKEIIKQKPKATKPLEIIEIDIKYIYIDGECRNGYLITIFDVFHRQAYNWTLNYNMKAKRIIDLLLEFIDQQIINTNIDPSKLGISFRTDNGSQFVSKVYRKLMERFNFRNVYIPPATPQLNGHIESFHSTVQRLVCDSHEFKNLDNAKEIFTDFYNTYNEERFLTCLLDYPPVKFLELWNKGLIGQKEHKKKLIFFFKEEDKKDKTNCFENLAPSL
jgi:putative transposase